MIKNVLDVYLLMNMIFINTIKFEIQNSKCGQIIFTSESKTFCFVEYTHKHTFVNTYMNTCVCVTCYTLIGYRISA